MASTAAAAQHFEASSEDVENEQNFTYKWTLV